MKYISLILLIFIFSLNSFAVDKILLKQENVVKIQEELSDKILTGKLLEIVSQKKYALDKGEKDPELEKTLVIIYLDNYPSAEQIQFFKSLDIECYLESWIPPLPNHPYGFFIAKIPIAKFIDALSFEFVKKMDTAEFYFYPENNAGAQKIFADTVWQKGFTGNGVKVAILDSGLDTDPAHSDLPTVFQKKDYSDYPEAVDDNVENTVTGHGTHVTGSVLGRGVLSSTNIGNGGGAYKGIAPNADLVFLKIGKDANAGATSSAIIAAMKAAVDTFNADILTISYGGWYAHHDGSSSTEQTVDWVYNQGRPFFISAGNEGEAKRHYSGAVGANDSTGFIQVNISGAGSSTALLFNLVWSDGIERRNLHLKFYNASYQELTEITNYTTTESIRGTESQYSNYDYYVPTGSSTYYLKVFNPSADSQIFHIYEDWNDGKVKFNSPNQSYTIGQPASADHAFSVAAYTSRSIWTDWNGNGWTYNYTLNDISPFSSRGPRIDGLQKPNISAPGSVIISIRDRDVYAQPNSLWIDNDGSPGGGRDYYVMQGTSMACPIAAGAAALILSRYPSVSPQEVYNALQNNTTIDSWTGFVPNNTWGFGKLNINSSIEEPSLPITLATFIVQYNQNDHTCLLEWTTISEINNYGFYVERKKDDEMFFTELPNSFIPGAGTTLEPRYYSYVDSTLTIGGIYHYRLRQVDLNGLIHYTYSVSVNTILLSVHENAPIAFQVFQNYPNPFNPRTTIKFSVEKLEHVSIVIYNLLGQEIAQIFNNIAEPGRYYSPVFDGSEFGNGVYYYKIKTETYSEIKKMVLVK